MLTNYSPEILGDPLYTVTPLYRRLLSGDSPCALTSYPISVTVTFTRPSFSDMYGSESESESDYDEGYGDDEITATFSKTLSLPAEALANGGEAAREALGELLSRAHLPPCVVRTNLAERIFQTVVREGEGVTASLDIFVNELPDESLERAVTEEVVTCSICLEEIPAGSESTRLPCLHWYHRGCIAQWMNKKRCCPMCRFELP